MLTVFSDLHCPWAYVFTIRLRRARAAVDQPPVAWRCWPLELVNERGTPGALSPEIPVLTQLEPDHFAPPKRETWPSTLLPAMEALKWPASWRAAAADRFDERPAGPSSSTAATVDPAHPGRRRRRGRPRPGQVPRRLRRRRHRRSVIADCQEGRAGASRARPTPSSPRHRRLQPRGRRHRLGPWHPGPPRRRRGRIAKLVDRPPRRRRSSRTSEQA